MTDQDRLGFLTKAVRGYSLSPSDEGDWIEFLIEFGERDQITFAMPPEAIDRLIDELVEAKKQCDANRQVV